MTEEIVKILSVDAGDSNTSVKQLRKEIKLLKDELLNLDETSTEYNQVLGALADRTFAMRDMNELVRYSAADLGEQIATVNRLATGLASGFGAVQGAIAIFGSESETVEKTMVRLQGVIALVQGLQGLEGLSKDIKAASIQFRSATTAVKGFITGLSGIKKALLATGLGILVVVIGEVIANWDKISQLWKDTSPQDEATAAVERLKNALDGLDFYLQQQNLKALKKYNEALAEAGNNTEAVDKATKEYQETLRNNELESLSRQLKEANEQSSKLIDIKYELTQQGKKESDEYAQIEHQLWEVNKTVIQLSSQYENLINKGYLEGAKAAKTFNKEIQKTNDILNDNSSAIDTKQIEAIKKRIEEQGMTQIELRTKQFEQEKELFRQAGQDITELVKEYNADIAKIQNENLRNNIESQKEIILMNIDTHLSLLSDNYESLKSFYDADYANKMFSLESNGYVRPEDKYNLQKSYYDKLIELEQYINSQQKEILNERINDESLYFDVKVELMNRLEEIENEHTNKIIELQNKERDNEIQCEQKKLAARKATYNGLSTILSATATLIGENTKAGKAAAVASTLINTWASAEEAYRAAFNPGGVWSPALGAVYMAAAIATGLANVKSIMSINTETGTGSSSTAAAVTPSLDISRNLPVEYTRNLLSDSETTELNNSQRVYVLESDITSTQNKVSVVESNATF